MNEQCHDRGAETARAIRVFLATYDRRDASDQEIVFRIRARVHSKLYRYEREQCAEWIDLGGEGGEK